MNGLNTGKEDIDAYHWLKDHAAELDEPARREQLEDIMGHPGDRVDCDIELFADESDHEAVLVELIEIIKVYP